LEESISTSVILKDLARTTTIVAKVPLLARHILRKLRGMLA